MISCSNCNIVSQRGYKKAFTHYMHLAGKQALHLNK